MEEKNKSTVWKIRWCEAELEELDNRFSEYAKSFSTEKDPVKKREIIPPAVAKLDEYMAKLNEIDKLRDQLAREYEIRKQIGSIFKDDSEKEIKDVSPLVKDEGSQMVNPIIIELKNNINERNMLKKTLGGMIRRLKDGHSGVRLEEIFLSCIDMRNQIDQLTRKINSSVIDNIIHAKKLNENTVAQVHDEFSLEQMPDLLAAARKYKESLPKEQLEKLEKNEMKPKR